MVNIARLNLLADEVKSHPSASRLNHLADQFRREQQMVQAERSAMDCIGVARGLEDHKCEGIGCLSLGLVYHAKGLFEPAVRKYEEARHSLHLEADVHGESLSLIALGLAHHDHCLADSAATWPSVFVYFRQGIDLMHRLAERTRLSKQFVNAEAYDRTIERLTTLHDDVYREYVAQLSDWPKRGSVSPPPPPNGQDRDTSPPRLLTLQAFPVYDSIAAGRRFTFVGQPISTYIVLNEVEIDGMTYQPARVDDREFAVKRLVPQAAHFGVRVSGESMIDLGIESDDIVLVEQGRDVEEGQVAAVRIGDEATLKRVFPRSDHILLRPENKAEPSIVIVQDLQKESSFRQQYPEADGFEILVEADADILGTVVAVFKPSDENLRDPVSEVLGRLPPSAGGPPMASPN